MIQKIINFFSENVFSKEFGIVGAILGALATVSLVVILVSLSWLK